MNLYSRLRCVIHMQRATNCTARGEYEAAMRELRQVYDLCRASTIPAPDVPITVNLLAALVALRLQAYEQSVMCASQAVADLRAMRGKFTADERAYLDRYAKGVGTQAAYLGDTGTPWSSVLDPVPKGKIGYAIRSTFQFESAEA